jgi:hypothetical protein
MTFVRSDAWIWALLAVPLVLLYLRQRGPCCVTVAAGFLWERVFTATPSRSRWLRWRKAISLVVELAVLMLLVAAMAEPAGDAWRWQYLAATAVAALVFQWYLFQRRWVC